MTEPDIDPSIDPILPEATAGPGHRLRQARERKGLNVGEVSDRLHLPARLVTAIESDHYAELPGAVFVRGYLRNYARLVGEPADVILQMFNDVRPREEYTPALRQFQLPMKANQVNSSHGLVKTVTWLIVIALLILLIVWWRGYIKLPVPMLGEEDIPANSVKGGPVGPRAPTPASSGEATVLQIPRPVKPLTTMAEETPSDARAPSADLEATAGIAVVQEEPASDERAIEPAGETALQETAPKNPSAIVVSSPPANDVELPASGGDRPSTDEVRLVFEAPCWVDIRDASGKKVLYGGIGAGEIFSLSGTPPYQVVLGNTSAVKITVGGRSYPIHEHSKGRVARFALDPAKALMAANGSEQ